MPGRSSGTKRRGAAQRKRAEPPLAEDGQEYARVVTMLGNNRVRAKFADGADRQCRIRGSMRRREWIHVGDLVLVAMRDLAGDKADIVFKYQPAEVQRLRRLGEPVGIAIDEEEATMEDFVTFEGDPEPAAQAQRHRPGMPDDSHDDSEDESSEDDVDWERI